MKPDTSRLEEAKAELAAEQREIELCSLGDRPMHPGVARMQRVEFLRREVEALQRQADASSMVNAQCAEVLAARNRVEVLEAQAVLDRDALRKSKARVEALERALAGVMAITDRSDDAHDFARRVLKGETP